MGKLNDSVCDLLTQCLSLNDGKRLIVEVLLERLIHLLNLALNFPIYILSSNRENVELHTVFDLDPVFYGRKGKNHISTSI